MTKKPKKRRIKQVALKENEVLKVIVPKAMTPVVATDLEKDEVLIAPTHKQTWMEWVFGTTPRKA